MADEISIQVFASVNNGNLKSTFNHAAKKITQSSQGLHHPVVSVGTSEEDFDPGDVGAANQGVLCMLNLDATNYVKYGPKSAGAMVEFGRIMPGEKQTFRLAPSIVMRWIANSAACNVEVWLCKS